MAVTQADIDALNRAIADGVRSVTIRGQTVTYNTAASLIAARDDLRRELAAASGQPQPSRRTYLYHAGRGY
jgi:hypothetical protein